MCAECGLGAVCRQPQVTQLPVCCWPMAASSWEDKQYTPAWNFKRWENSHLPSTVTERWGRVIGLGLGKPKGLFSEL